MIPINTAFCIFEGSPHGQYRRSSTWIYYTFLTGLEVPLIDAYDASRRLPKGCDKVPVVEYVAGHEPMIVLRGRLA